MIFPSDHVCKIREACALSERYYRRAGALGDRIILDDDCLILQHIADVYQNFTRQLRCIGVKCLISPIEIMLLYFSRLVIILANVGIFCCVHATCLLIGEYCVYGKAASTDIFCIAAPVFAPQGHVVGALAISLSPDALARRAEWLMAQVVRAANHARAELRLAPVPH